MLTVPQLLSGSMPIPTNVNNSPVLFDSRGLPISTEGKLLSPGALNVASIYQFPGRIFPFTWDEALRESPNAALAMKRDAFYRRLLQERCGSNLNLEWQVKVPDETDPRQLAIKTKLDACWARVPDKIGLATSNLYEGCWSGRAGAQMVWDRTSAGITTVYHEPVNGDSVNFRWNMIPVLSISYQSANRLLALDPSCVVTSSQRGSWLLMLNKPEYRRRFTIYQHVREAADYFEGEMSGGIGGVGLRSWAFWTDFLRRKTIEAIMSFMLTTGMMEIYIFNYLVNDAASEEKAAANAKQISGKLAILNPLPLEVFRTRMPIEQLKSDTNGISTLMEVLTRYFDTQLEQLFVGQSMSTGGQPGGRGDMGGSARSEFAQSTKYDITLSDAKRLETTYSRDWAKVALALNFPGVDLDVALEPVLDDPKAAAKVESGEKLIKAGVPIEAEEWRRAAGFRNPRPGRVTVGDMPAPLPGAPGQPGQPPATPPGTPGATPPTVGNPAQPPVQAPESDEQIAASLAGLIGELNALAGVRMPGDARAILAALQSRGGAAYSYSLERATDGRFGRQAGQHNPREQGGRQATSAAPNSGGSVGNPAGPNAEPVHPLRQLGSEHNQELGSPGVWERAQQFGARVADTVRVWAMRASPVVMMAAEELFDTPNDMRKFGYAPSMSGTSFASGDPTRAALGISTHLACSIASKVLAYAIVKVKGSKPGNPSGATPQPAAA